VNLVIAVSLGAVVSQAAEAPLFTAQQAAQGKAI